MIHLLNRRRFISIAASVAGSSLFPFSLSAKEGLKSASWRGQALGASASIIVHHPDHAAAALLVNQAAAEVARLEGIFSLYRQDSALSELNKTGALAAPAPELFSLLEKSREVWELSSGAFDPTVQPVWTLLAAHFGGEDPDPAGPPEAKLHAALNLVGFGNVRYDENRIAFARRGMALTLNGIAQGFIADRVVGLLRAGGVTKSLVDTGEIRAIGSRLDETPWRVGIRGEFSTNGLSAVLELEDRAVATSSPDGFRFGDGSRFSHLIDPRSGLGASLYRSTVVVAPDAASADAFSTAFSLLPPNAVKRIVTGRSGLQVRLLENSEPGRLLAFG
ncbi:FAD:protein FMN transferase [Pseudaminobacter arsenicus]|uniref:FAD:protein FMN transferase n=1 Tax=Borborobacter arsenicus TaxID=1851146 RepID=A0A432UZT6_9HYPH|nr:FAD:protein FMN transferase [Pseudaminobacter arsenicus]RUM95449.1 FAD:protein FMN transferase [Pseudaminobacter arsenicus]